jgi:hypothetical protein
VISRVRSAWTAARSPSIAESSRNLAASAVSLLAATSSSGKHQLRSHLEGIWQSLLVEGVDGVACRLRIAAQLVSDLVGVLAPVAGEQNLAERRKVKASGERKPASRDSRSASLKGRTKIGRFMLWRITTSYRPVWKCTSRGMAG